MLYYLLFWAILGFIIHFYIIFGTNLLTGGPAQNSYFFCLFQCFEEKEYQTESKRDETFGSDLFGTNANRETWSGRQAMREAATRVPSVPLGVGVPPTSWVPRASTEGVLDKGVSGQPDYILWPDCWTVKIQDSRLRPVSGWDSPLRGRQAS